MADQATLVVIKPDAIQRQLMGAVLSRLEPLQLEIIGAKALQVDRAMAEAHYKHLQEKPFFGITVDHLQGKLHGTKFVLAFIFWGPEAIARVRDVMGATHPEKADPRSIRGSFGRMTEEGLMENIMHASESAAEAEREIKLWFQPSELLREPYLTRQSAWV